MEQNTQMPNFDRLGNLAMSFGQEIKLCSNMPSVRQDIDLSTILAAIAGMRAEMRQEIGTLRQEMRQEIGALRQEMFGEINSLRQEMRDNFTRLERKIDAEKHNNLARLANSRYLKSTDALEPLRGEDNTDISDFPANPEAIRNIRNVELTEILRRLGVSTAGSVAAKQARLLRHAGVIHELREQN